MCVVVREMWKCPVGIATQAEHLGAVCDDSELQTLFFGSGVYEGGVCCAHGFASYTTPWRLHVHGRVGCRLRKESLRPTLRY